MTRRTAGALLASLAASPLRANDLEDPSVNFALQWNDATVTGLRRAGASPTVAARTLAIVHSAIYDAWATYEPTAAASIPGGPAKQPNGFGSALVKSSALSYAAYRVLLELVPSQTSFYRDMMANILVYDPSITTTNVSTSMGVGNVVAANHLNYRRKDGANQLGDLGGGTPYADYTGYQPVNTPDLVTDPNRWQPLRNADGSVQQFLTPHWSKVTPFALKSADQFRPAAQPPQAGNWLYQQRVRDTLQQSAELSDEAMMGAEYWEDSYGTDTPAGHWNRIGQEISQRDQHNLDDDVKMFFALNVANLDTSIAVWEAKRFYDSIRPTSAIRYYYNGQSLPGAGNKLVAGASWSPWNTTPAWPEFPSENSAFAFSGAEILRRFTGNDVYAKKVSFAAGASKKNPGSSPAAPVSLGWFTFSQIAEDAANAGQSGGIHFADAILHGGLMGRAVAAQAWDRYTQLLNGVRT